MTAATLFANIAGVPVGVSLLMTLCITLVMPLLMQKWNASKWLSPAGSLGVLPHGTVNIRHAGSSCLQSYPWYPPGMAVAHSGAPDGAVVWEVPPVLGFLSLDPSEGSTGGSPVLPPSGSPGLPGGGGPPPPHHQMSKLGFEGYNLLKPPETSPNPPTPQLGPQVGSDYNLQKPKETHGNPWKPMKPTETPGTSGAFSIGGPKICYKNLPTVGLEPEAIQ